MNNELQAAKDQAAREAGWENWKHISEALHAYRMDEIINRAMEIYAEMQSKKFAEWIAQNCRMYENEFSLYNLNEDVLEQKTSSQLYQTFKNTKP